VTTERRRLPARLPSKENEMLKWRSEAGHQGLMAHGDSGFAYLIEVSKADIKRITLRVRQPDMTDFLYFRSYPSIYEAVSTAQTIEDKRAV
jgi:hypothetical protein